MNSVRLISARFKVAAIVWGVLAFVCQSLVVVAAPCSLAVVAAPIAVEADLNMRHSMSMPGHAGMSMADNSVGSHADNCCEQTSCAMLGCTPLLLAVPGAILTVPENRSGPIDTSPFALISADTSTLFRPPIVL